MAVSTLQHWIVQYKAVTFHQSLSSSSRSVNQSKMSLKFTVSFNTFDNWDRVWNLKKTSFQLAALVLVLAVTYINCAPFEATESNSENDQTFFNIFCKSFLNQNPFKWTWQISSTEFSLLHEQHRLRQLPDLQDMSLLARFRQQMLSLLNEIIITRSWFSFLQIKKK